LTNKAQETLHNMTDEELDKLILHLGRYALSVSNNYTWRTGDSISLPGGETVESVVSKALEKVLSGDRRWDPQKDPDIKKYLMDVIDSLMSHLAASSDNKLLTVVPAEGSENAEAWQSGSKKADPEAAWLARQSMTPEKELEAKEAAELEEHAIQMLLKEAKNDAALTAVIRAMLDGANQCGEIAEVIGIDVTEVYKAMKRLDRKAAAVRRKLNNQGAAVRINK